MNCRRSVCTRQLLALGPVSRMLALTRLQWQWRAISYANQVITDINTHCLTPCLLASNGPFTAASLRTIWTQQDSVLPPGMRILSHYLICTKNNCTLKFTTVFNEILLPFQCENIPEKISSPLHH